MPRLLVGTSGYSYPHWRGVLYPEGLPQRSWLERYAQVFPAVELNVTFYRLPSADTFRDWAARTPPAFRFGLKGSRLVTHYRRLAECDEAVGEFLDHACGLSEKLESVLWQLPPTLPADRALLAGFCELLSRQTVRARHAFEFRHESWFAPETYATLEQYSHALCVADAPSRAPIERVTAPFVYVRLHAGAERDDGGYSERELVSWGERARAWLAEGLDVYAFFNNDAEGCAVRDAQRLIALSGAAAPTGRR